jgi:hypothetical protein
MPYYHRRRKMTLMQRCANARADECSPLLPDGKIVVAGSFCANGSRDFALARYHILYGRVA